jgi:hypothetical protein
MPRPEDVRPAKFPDPDVVFDNGEFAIADGHWEGTNPCLAVRWNGAGTDPGYPKLFGNPTWLVMPEPLSVPILSGLLAGAPPGARSDAVLRALGRRAG